MCQGISVMGYLKVCASLSKFTSRVIDQLKKMWGDLKIVHGRPSQGSVEIGNGDIKDMFTAWMADKQYRLDSWIKICPIHEQRSTSCWHNFTSRDHTLLMTMEGQ